MGSIRNFFEQARASLWALPAAMSVLAACMAIIIQFSGIEGLVTAENWWLFSGDAGTARDLVSTLLSGIITMSSLVVSITMVVLSLAAGQLGPRLIRSFLVDRQIQSVIGLFAGTIVYSILTLRSITDDLSDEDVPHIGVTACSVLSVICLFALLFYIHKVARSIIADTVVTEVADDLETVIARAGETYKDAQHSDKALPELAVSDAIALESTGYVQVISRHKMVEIAQEQDLVFRINCRPGNFLLRGGAHVEVLGGGKADDAIRAKVRACFVIGQERTPTQDLEFSIRQLVEIAIRALSPGMNDSFTAIEVINRLGAALEAASHTTRPPEQYFDTDDTLRVIAVTQDFKALTDAAFNQIRQSATDQPAVLIQMARILTALKKVATNTDHKQAIDAHLKKLGRAAKQNIKEPQDLADFEDELTASL